MAKDFSQSSIRKIEICQQCCFGFTADKIKIFLSEFKSIKNYAYIIHDKDDTEPHIHLFLWFGEPVPVKNILQSCFKVFGIYSKVDKKTNSNIDVPVISLQNLERIKSKGLSYCIAYLVHANEDDSKHKYSSSEIVSNLDLSDIQAKIKEGTKKEFLLSDIANKIDSGEIRRYNLFDYISIIEYNRYKSDINNFFEYRFLKLEKEVNRCMECFYFFGGSGTGKTTYAKQFCIEHNYSFFISSAGTDFLDGYLGEDVIIFDDIRPDNLKSVSDFLKLTDNNTNSLVRSRYKNKNICECKYLIFTCIMTLKEFFSSLCFDRKDKEEFKQVQRRFKCVANFTTDKIFFYNYLRTKNEYKLVSEIKNETYQKYNYDEYLDMSIFPGVDSHPVEELKQFSLDDFETILDLKGGEHS